MKNYFYLFVILVVMCECTSVTQKNIDTTSSTQNLLHFLKKYDKYSVGNKIQEEELFNKREKDLITYIDSIGIFTNLKGKINDIRLEESNTGKSKILSYDIEIKPEKYFELTFECAHIIDKDSLDYNMIYNKVKEMSNYSTVYFDGVISINAEENLPRSCIYDIDLSFNYPKYKFHVINISTSQLDSVSNNLRNSIISGRKSMNYIFKDYRKEKDYKKVEFKLLSDEFNKTKTVLTDNEQRYIQRYMNAIFLDIY